MSLAPGIISCLAGLVSNYMRQKCVTLLVSGLGKVLRACLPFAPSLLKSLTRLLQLPSAALSVACPDLLFFFPFFFPPQCQILPDFPLTLVLGDGFSVFLS